jgi:hypothetical protein
MPALTKEKSDLRLLSIPFVPDFFKNTNIEKLKEYGLDFKEYLKNLILLTLKNHSGII